MTLTLPYGFGCCGRRQRPSGRVKTRVEIRKSSLRAFLFRSGLVKPPATEVRIDVPVMETYYVPITLALGPPHRKGGSPSALICEGRGLCPVGGGEEYHVTYVVEPNPLSKTNNTGEVSLSHFRRSQYQHTVYIQDLPEVWHSEEFVRGTRSKRPLRMPGMPRVMVGCVGQPRSF